jgi:ribosome recycling factor
MAVSTMASTPALKTIHQQLKQRMEKAVNDFRQNLASTRTGRANIQMLDHVRVLYYGSEMPLNQVAQLSIPDAQTILIQPFDPTAIAEIEKGIRAADSSFNPQNDGKVVRLKVPAMTEERRRDVVKQLNKVLEEHRTGIRNIRRDGNDAIKKATKDKLISEDEEKRAIDEVQKLTDEEIRRMEELSRDKERQVMQV